ncbi:hypothetical protein N9368_02105 [Alphaproteobacteria bacterium]|nr:hypothetical protein [Alphaproteobacteria bacterium]
MEHYASSLAPRVVFTYIGRTVLVMLGRLPMNAAYLMTPSGLWQAIWTSVIIAFVVSLYPVSGVGTGFLLAKVAAQIIAMALLSLLAMNVLTRMGLADKIFDYLVPFIWVQNVQYLAAGLAAYAMMLGGSDQMPIIFFGPLLVWTIYWLWRAGRDQIGRGGWVATGFLLLSLIVDSVVTFALLSRVHSAAG